MIYLDTGCLIKLYYPEPETARVASLINGRPIFYIPLHELEFNNAMSLKVFFKAASPPQIIAARNLILQDLASGVLTSLPGNWRDIFGQATILAQQYTPGIGCRSLDILHCAAAKVLGAVEFISTDIRQQALATACGLNLVAP